MPMPIVRLLCKQLKLWSPNNGNFRNPEILFSKSFQRHFTVAATTSATATIFKKYGDGYEIRSMTADDVRTVQNWYLSMGNISKYDVEIMFNIYPPGSPGMYAGYYNGEMVASLIRLPWANHIYYGSYYYVDKRFRKRGFGTRLKDELATEYLGDNILCVDAVSEVRTKTLERFKNNNKEVFKTARYQCKAQPSYSKQTFKGRILTAENVAFEKLIEYDNRCFISQNFPTRREFLKRWISIPGGASYVFFDGDGQMIGFGCRHPCIQKQNHIIGPLYANNGTVAEALLAKLCSDVAGEMVTINIWCPNKSAVSMVEKFGFEHVFDLTRIHTNGDAKEYKDEVFALTSIDVCGF